MAGASSVLLMFLAPNASWWGFDFPEEHKVKGRTEGAGAFLENAFPNKAKLILGDSLLTVPKFILDHPDLKCDVVILDGGKTYTLRQKDSQNFREISHEHTLVILDEICDNKYVSGEGSDSLCDGVQYGDVSKAYRDMVKQNMLTVVDCVEKISTEHGFCVGKYLYSNASLNFS